MFAEPETTTTTTTTGDARWKREFERRGSSDAAELAVFVSGLSAADRDDAMAWLRQQRGEPFVDQIVAAASASPFSGSMLVSNNPEGLSSPGRVMEASAKRGNVAVYVHHSNHMKAPLGIHLVVRPEGGRMSARLAGAAAATGGPKRASGKDAGWRADPNVIVAAANEARGDAKDPDSQNRTNVAKTIDEPTAIKLGTLPAGGRGDPPLFDARYDLELGGDATLEIVAERSGPDEATNALAEQRPATGNTKYESAVTNGRAAGVYGGARFASDDTARVSELPFTKRLTGTKFDGGPAPAALERQRTVTPAATDLAAMATAKKTSLDAAAVVVLERMFRIAPDWLRERGVWNGASLNAAGLTSDYVALIEAVRAAVREHDDMRVATTALLAKYPHVGATLDAASYGTMYDVAILLDNDTKTAASVGLDFRTDAAANAKRSPGAVYRGLVSVDGVDHAINHDTAHGRANHVELATELLAPDATKHVHVRFQSPGQISAGQEIAVTKKP
jgi:hypothetical protein